MATLDMQKFPYLKFESIIASPAGTSATSALNTDVTPERPISMEVQEALMASVV
ncbi:MAG: hypothetical protein KGS72_08240 [Cyanobacteria bacterium REEB67]|nr:hypothetical protein [Cyanobacteria bacterium REEB67]